MNDQIRRVLDRLDGVKRSGTGWIARCPAHDDTNPSLTVDEAGDGKVLLKCFAGCGFEEIVSALGVKAEDLFPAEDAPDNRYSLTQYARDKRLPGTWLREEFALRTHQDRALLIPYRDRAGEVVAKKYRTGESFWWEKGATLRLYGIERLADAAPDQPVLIVEGESDVHVCAFHGALAVGVPGATTWRSEWAEEVGDERPVYVWREPDQGGEALIDAVAGDLSSARVVEAPEDAKDPAELHLNDPDAFKDRLAKLLDDARPIREVAGENGEREDADEASPSDETQTGWLLALTADLEPFHDERDTAFVRIEQQGHMETWRVGGETCKGWLAYQFYLERDRAPSTTALTEAVQVLKGRARFEGERRKLSNRIAWHEGALWYDLGDEAWRAVKIEPGRWEIVNDPPPLFRRFAHQKAQVEPVPTDAERLPQLIDPFLNLPVEASHERNLLYVWLPTALVADIPRAVLMLYGVQGAAKTAATKMLRGLVDPSAVPIPNFPTRGRELAQALDHNAVLALDNVSQLKRSLSDMLCKAVTGGGFTKRRLYTDEEDVLFEFRRAVIVNGINVPATQPDLLDRCVLVKLERIPEDEMRPEQELWAEFESVQPQIVGAMLDALAKAMEILPKVDIGPLPRMADWTRYGYAASEAMGIGGDRFLEAYRANRQVRNQEALTSHPVGAAIMAFMRHKSEWTGTATWLLDELEAVANREGIDMGSKLWPGAANWLTKRIREVEPNLADAGIGWDPEWKWDDKAGKLVRLWKTGSGSGSE